MLLVLLVMGLAAMLALLTGGRFTRLAEDPLTGLRWLAAAAAGQVAGSLSGSLVYASGLVCSAICIGVFLRLNVHRPGVALLALGFGSNALVVALNGAMPVSLSALARAGLDATPDLAADPRHEVSGAGTMLSWLGDVVPVALPGLGQAVSPGDVLTAAGAGLVLYVGMGAGRLSVPHRAVPSWEALGKVGNAA
ncbi:MAG TPA: DUF5317 domain-containing protein [Kribbella sp.]|nr:DUF5317 domain-containing protein [Kribbella sp.]